MSMPSVTVPNGAKPWPSSEAPLSLKLMKSCVVRVFGPAVANTTVPALVALLHRIVLDVGVLPNRVDRGIGGQSELNDEVRHDAEERGVGEEAVPHQVVEAVRPDRRPIAMHLDDEIALAWS